VLPGRTVGPGEELGLALLAGIVVAAGTGGVECDELELHAAPSQSDPTVAHAIITLERVFATFGG
jgi:hypothetical protein